MKKLAFIAVLMTSISAFGLDLQELIKDKEKLNRNGVDFYIEPHSSIKKDILSGKFDEVVKNMKIDDDPRQGRAVNPSLSMVHIYEVESTKGGLEVINYRQGVTKRAHGGSLFKLSTKMLGFGCLSDVASFKKQFVRRIESTFVVRGNRAVGCVDVRDLSNKSSNGNFVFTARNSSGFSARKISESLFIK
ncbi:DUF4879 domain-containing protein [Campylobacter troglodytis]|uniref:DUF4879 domain-containing protein n=1 Tax=Campylobacter troglodytis TaxID=654363 RepID=UPI00115B9D4B|nr:DUF4879 domain-containing protein [Campylobacter troglodytis]